MSLFDHCLISFVLCLSVWSLPGQFCAVFFWSLPGQFCTVSFWSLPGQFCTVSFWSLPGQFCTVSLCFITDWSVLYCVSVRSLLGQLLCFSVWSLPGQFCTVTQFGHCLVRDLYVCVSFVCCTDILHVWGLFCLCFALLSCLVIMHTHNLSFSVHYCLALTVLMPCVASAGSGCLRRQRSTLTVTLECWRPP